MFVDVRADNRMFRRDLSGQLCFVAPILIAVRIGNVREGRLPGLIDFLISTSTEEPQPVAEDTAAESSFILVVEVIQRVYLTGEVSLVRPARVGEIVSE